MQKLIILLLIILSINLVSASCEHTIKLDEGYFPDGLINNQKVLPGDTICIEEGYRNRIKIKNLHGTIDKPITITNNGQVFIDSTKPECEPYINSKAPSELNCGAFSYGFSLENSSYIILTGKKEYGIKIRTPFAGASVIFSHASDNIEASYLEIFEGKSSGIKAKTDPTCNLRFTRNNWIAENFNFHHNYIHDMGDEGFYIGNSFFRDGQKKDCKDENNNELFDDYEELYQISDPNEDLDNDGLTNLEEQSFGLNPLIKDSSNKKVVEDGRIRAHEIHNIKVHDNIIENTGMDGIQVSSSTKNCEIYNNIITKDSQNDIFNQKSGIIIGGGGNCDVFENKIKDGKGPGILFLGHSGNIYNNQIINPGANKPTYEEDQDKGKIDGIYLIDKSGDDMYETPRSININNNYILNPKRDGIRYYNKKTTNNQIHKNIIINPGSGEYYIRNNQWAGKEPAEFIYLEKNRINRDEINGDLELEEFLIINPTIKSEEYDNIGFDSYELYQNYNIKIDSIYINNDIVTNNSKIKDLDDEIKIEIISDYDNLIINASIPEWDIYKETNKNKFTINLDSDKLDSRSKLILNINSIKYVFNLYIDNDDNVIIDNDDNVIIDNLEIDYDPCENEGLIDISIKNKGFKDQDDLLLKIQNQEIITFDLDKDKTYFTQAIVKKEPIIQAKIYYENKDLADEENIYLNKKCEITSKTTTTTTLISTTTTIKPIYKIKSKTNIEKNDNNPLKLVLILGSIILLIIIIFIVFKLLI